MVAAGQIVACVQTEATKEERDGDREIAPLDRQHRSRSNLSSERSSRDVTILRDAYAALFV
jgi:hypothetical protein